MDELHNLIEEKDVDMVVFPAIDYDEDTGTYNKHEYFSMSELFGLVANTVVDWKPWKSDFQDIRHSMVKVI